MKNLLLSLGLLITLNSFSQLGENLEVTKQYLKNNTDISKTLEIDFKDGTYCLSSTVINSEYISDKVYYFKKTMNKCYMLRIIYKNKDFLNSTISDFNNRCVKLGEFFWKDYKTNELIRITFAEGDIYYVDFAFDSK